MGNSAASKIEGTGKVILKFTYGKKLYVVHVPDIGKNLIFDFVLGKNRFKITIEFDKFILTKGGLYIGKGYLVDGLFKVKVVVMDIKSKFLYP